MKKMKLSANSNINSQGRMDKGKPADSGGAISKDICSITYK